MPRGPAAVDAVHAHGDQFHALAEFHWGGWSQVPGMTWTQKALEFRARMLARGYDPVRDAWAINELPSTTKSDPQVRQNVMDVVTALYENAGKSPPNGGMVWVIGVGSKMTNFAVYKPALEGWLADATFWTTMNKYVRWWGQEAYARPVDVCVGNATVAARQQAIDAFAMHPARLAAAGPAACAAARSFFDESYVPTQSAFWHGVAYDTTTTSLDNMRHLVSTEIYASRIWAAGHKYPDARIALAWNDQLDGATQADLDALAARIAQSIHDAYAEGGPAASKACSPSGAYTWCACDVAGAAFNGAWSAFDSW
jgi:hypothetical protein